MSLHNLVDGFDTVSKSIASGNYLIRMGKQEDNSKDHTQIIGTTEGFQLTIPKQMSKEQLKAIWAIYQGKICELPVEQKTPQERLCAIANLMQNISHFKMMDSEIFRGFQSFEKDTQKYINTLKIMQKTLREYILQKAEQEGITVLKNNNLDTKKEGFHIAEKYIIQTYEDIFKHHLRMDDLEKSYKVAIKIRFTAQGAKGLFTLAMKYLLQSKHKEAILCLNNICASCLESEDIRSFFESLGAITMDRWETIVKEMKNKGLVEKLMPKILEKTLNPDSIWMHMIRERFQGNITAGSDFRQNLVQYLASEKLNPAYVSLLINPSNT